MFSLTALDKLEADLGRDLVAFAPELLLCAGVVGMLLLRLLPRFRAHLGSVALVVTALGTALALVPMLGQAGEGGSAAGPFVLGKSFGGMLALDHLTNYVRLILFGFGVLVVWLSLLTGIPDAEDSADFYALLLGGLLGMVLMAAANHLLMVFIAVEMASLPSYGLAGFLKGRRQSSEAALKYVVYGGGASGVMLYGISLIAGRFGTGDLNQVADAIRQQLAAGAAVGGLFNPENTTIILGLVFILVGLAFKLSAVPFHFWCPDVFEGAAAEVAAFLSVASKAAAMALTGRLLLTLVGTGTEIMPAIPKTFGPAVALLAAITATFGNLAAYAQTNLKRLLAYSTIAHAGYMLMGLAPMTHEGVAAVLFYLTSYVFMNLGAFAVVALLRNKTGSEDLQSFRGLIYRSPLLVCLLAVFLLSLLGLPPLVGFAAKFQVFQVLFKSGQTYAASSPTLSYTMYALLVIGGLNTVFSVFYYLKVLKVMVLEQPLAEVENTPPAPLRVSLGAAAYGVLLAAAVVVGGVAWGPLATASDRGVLEFHPPTGSMGGPVINMGAGAGGGGGRPANRPKGN